MKRESKSINNSFPPFYCRYDDEEEEEVKKSRTEKDLSYVYSSILPPKTHSV